MHLQGDTVRALAHLPVNSARLPASYEAAQLAISNCVRIDEVKDWADKAQALASYARQAQDLQLEKQCQRIRARAIRRCGELLQQIDGRGGDRKSQIKSMGNHTFDKTQKQAAAKAGLSKFQKDQAVRIAQVPIGKFEALVDSEKPATLTALANEGKTERPKKTIPLVDLNGQDPKVFNQCMHFVGAIERFIKDVEQFDFEVVLKNLSAAQVKDLKTLVPKIDALADKIMTRI